MEESQAKKRRRVYAFNPDEGVHAWFLHEYVNYLVPVLTKTLATKENLDRETAEIVRFQVDMALVLAAKGFAWSHALKHRLETKMSPRALKLTTPTHISTSKIVHMMYNKYNYVEMLNQLSALPPLQRPSPPLGKPNHNCRKPKNTPFPFSKTSRRTKRKRVRCEEEQLGCRVRTLRRLLPGGDVMEIGELLSELQSYVVCLELQVSILGSLVDSQRV